jgi:hypothetical protein
LAVDHGRSPPGDSFWPPAEALHVAGRRGGPVVADEAGNVLQRLVTIHESVVTTVCRPVCGPRF